MNQAQLIKQKIKEEYKKCLEDPAYFMKKYCKIQHPKKGNVLFKLYPFQEDTLRQFRDNPKNIILKCRQMGISTLCAGYIMWLMTFHSDKSVLIIATKQTVAINMVQKIRNMNDSLPSWLRVESTENSKTSLRLKNGSVVKAVSASADAGRSEALSLLVVDECAFIEQIDEIWTSVQSAMTHGGGNAIILSTPNGQGNFFYRMWNKGEEGENGFNCIKLHWTLHPEYDQAWRDDQDKLLGPKAAAQECDCSFVSSGNSLVPLDLIEWYENTTMQDPISKEYLDHNYWRWAHPNYNKQYIVSADCGRGDGEDYSAFHVIDPETCEQVAEYKGQIETKDYGNLLVQVATEWNTALLVVENANIGWAVIQQILDRGYPNLFYMTDDIKYVDAENQTTNKHRSADKKKVAGFSTTMRTRPLIISKIELFFTEKSVIIRSKRTLNEMKTFIWHNGKVQAAKGFNDDLAMSLGIGLWVQETALTLRNKGNALMRAAMGGIGKTSFAESGIAKSSHIRGRNQHTIDPYSLNLGGGNIEDLKWLL